jgi:hypothetical protein
MTYNELKPKQQEFILWLFDDGNQDPDNTEFKRDYLKRVANENGMAWAPAWIVKDPSRTEERGYYMVPELADFIENDQDQDEDTSSDPEQESAQPIDSDAAVVA